MRSIFLFVIIQAERGGEGVGDVIRDIEVETAPEVFHLAAVFFRRTSRSPVALEEECLHRCAELGKFLGRSLILGIVRNKLGSLSLIYELQYLICIYDSSFARNDRITYLNGLRRLGICAIYSDLTALAGVCSLCPGLIYPYGPEVFVYPYLFHG